MAATYGGGDIADASTQTRDTTAGINIQSVGLNFGAIMQPYTDAANNGGYGLQLTRGKFSDFGASSPGTLSRTFELDWSDWRLVAGAAALVVGVGYLVMRKKRA